MSKLTASERTATIKVRLLPAALQTVCLLSMSGCGSGLDYSIPIPKSAIQQGIDAFMPISSANYIEEEVPVEIVADKATVLLKEGDERIGVMLDLTVQLPEETPKPPPFERPVPPALPFAPPDAPPIRAPEFQPPAGSQPPKTLHGTIHAWVGLRYEPANASFYCRSPEIDKLSFDELPPQLNQPVRETVQRLLADYLSRNAVYQLNDNSKVEGLAAATLKSVVVKEGKLFVTVGR